MMEKQRIALLGSTGSIGVQTLDIVRENSNLFEITTLTAHRNWQQLAKQAVEFNADSVVIADASLYEPLCQALAAYPIKVYAGEQAVAQVAADDNVDVVVNALVGYAGLMLTIFGERENVTVIRERDGERIFYEINLCDVNLFKSPAYYLQQNDIVYVQPNENKARQSTMDDKGLRMTSIFVSGGSLLVSLATLITSILLNVTR